MGGPHEMEYCELPGRTEHHCKQISTCYNVHWDKKYVHFNPFLMLFLYKKDYSLNKKCMQLLSYCVMKYWQLLNWF